MAWVPIAESGIAVTPDFPEGVSMAGSIVTGVRADLPVDQSWSLLLTPPAKVRITVQSFDSSGYSESGHFLLGGELIDNSGGPDEWVPNPVESSVESLAIVYGPGDQSDYPNDSYTMLVEVWKEDCCPLSNSRLFKGIASRYRASQHQPVRARRSQKRCLQVDFNGALDAGETVTRVTWECTSPWVTLMESACIGAGGRYVCTDVTFNYPGIGNIKATIDTSAGRRENYEFEITVTDAPMYPSARYIPSNGPYQLVAEA